MLIIETLVREAWSVIEPNLAGLTDDEYRWEPAEGCWSIRRRSDAAGDAWGKGQWVVETSFDGSRNPTSTTIAWRLMHAYDCFADYTAQAFGAEPRDWNDIEVTPDATSAVAMMNEAVEGLLHNLGNHDDSVLRGPQDHHGRPRSQLLDKGLLEWIHHCAEVGVMRDMYRLRPIA